LSLFYYFFVFKHHTTTITRWPKERLFAVSSLLTSPAKGFDLLDRKQQLGRRAIRLEKAPGRQVPYRLCREGELVRHVLDRQKTFPIIFHVIPFWPQNEAKSLPVLSERIIAWDFGGRGGTWSPYVGLDTASRRLAFDTHRVRASSSPLRMKVGLKYILPSRFVKLRVYGACISLYLGT
jgi:hypothetical protein